MDDRTVGFGFQADLVNTASLAHLLTGRVLKAMSDGGVDLYAVAASIWLGKHIPISSSLESSVYQQVTSRQQQHAGFLAKALSIGWGHSLIPCEMCRTKAGTAALVLIGALTTGSSFFTAAQVMSELLTVSGCEADKVPNVDVLKILVAYLSPFMQDLGFPKVLQHITTTCEHHLLKLGYEIPMSLSAQGDPPLLAGIIKQLCITSESEQTINMIPRQRTAWVAAFASHVLGMSVNVCMNDEVLWACGGTCGTVNLQIGSNNASSLVSKTRLDSGFVLIGAPTTRGCNNNLSLDYSPADALNVELNRKLELKSHLCSIQLAIARMCFSIAKNETFGTLVLIDGNHTSTNRKMHGHFPVATPIRQTLLEFGIPNSIISIAQDLQVYFPAWCPDELARFGLRHLDRDARSKMCTRCPAWENEPMDYTEQLSFQCNCIQAGRLIAGFSRAIAALAQCACDLKELRLNADYLNGSKTTIWSHQDDHAPQTSYKSSATCVLEHIGHLLFARDMSRSQVLSDTDEFAASTLGLSGGAYTVYYAAIKDHMAFQDDGRVLAIASGRASVGGILKKSIIQYATHTDGFRGPEPKLAFSDFVELSRGSLIDTQYCPSKLQIFVEASLTEHHILIETSMGFNPKNAKRIELRHSIDSFLIKAIIPECGHPVNDPWKVPGSRFGRTRYRLAPFGQIHNYVNHTLIYALKGDRLQQIIQFGLFAENSTVLQIQCCLGCAIAVADDQKRVVIGG